MHPRQVELVLREKTRARTFSVIRVVQTEGLAAASGGARKGKKPAAARAPAKKKAGGKAGAAGPGEGTTAISVRLLLGHVVIRSLFCSGICCHSLGLYIHTNIHTYMQ